jgi:hypothetical protein
MARLTKEIERTMEYMPTGNQEFEDEINKLLNDIEADLKSYGIKVSKPGDEPPEELLSGKPLADRQKKFFEEHPPETKRKRADGPVKSTGGPKRITKDPVDDSYVSLGDLGKELKKDPKDLRKLLRGKFEKPEGGRWEWKKDDPQLEKIRKHLQG